MPESTSQPDAGEPSEESEEDNLPHGKRYITRAGAERLHAELLRLLQKERPKVAAAAQGDRSENAEYIYGKKRLRQIDGRIHFLSRRLDTCTVVDPAEQKDLGRVYFGATVGVEDEEGKRFTYQLVGPDEIDATGGRVSVDSPVGRSLMGKYLNDEVAVIRPRGESLWTIVEIRYL